MRVMALSTSEADLERWLIKIMTIIKKTPKIIQNTVIICLKRK
jgi:hypothetical protein